MRVSGVLSLLLSFSLNAAAQPQVQLGSTTLIGRTIPGPPAVEFFGAIPFAETPVGNLRFAPPVPKTDLGITQLNATQFGSFCCQISVVDGQSEDCLFINVYRPAGIAANASLPVMFWIYGGGFYGGYSNAYDASYLVSHSITRGTPIIHVSFNYRVGPLGFPAGSEAQSHGALNLGIKDTYLALQWTQDNIHRFGGDKTKVTVFGESAGASITSILMLNPSVGQYMRAAIMESGSPGIEPPIPPSAREANWQLFVNAVPECAGHPAGNTFTCLRSADSATIAQAFATAYTEASTATTAAFIPVIDGAGGVYTDTPVNLYAQGHFAHFPFIQGNNLDEATFFVATTFNSTAEMSQYIVGNLSITSYPQSVQQRVINKLEQLYPDNPDLGSPFGTGDETFGFSSQWKRETALLGDILFHAPRRLFTRTLVNAGVTAYGYLLTDPQPELPSFLGVPHASDMIYLFPDLPLAPFNVARTADQMQLSAIMMDYWISFATSLTPNDHHGNTNRPQWPLYHNANPTLLQLNSHNMTTISDTYRKAGINYLIDEAITLDRHPLPS